VTGVVSSSSSAVAAAVDVLWNAGVAGAVSLETTMLYLVIKDDNKKLLLIFINNERLIKTHLQLQLIILKTGSGHKKNLNQVKNNICSELVRIKLLEF
jgi:hypothetical protein